MVAVGLALVAAGSTHAATADHSVVSGAVALRIADGWARVAPAAGTTGAEADPRTVLVVGTRGVAARASQCHVASYRIPSDGAAVVVPSPS